MTAVCLDCPSGAQAGPGPAGWSWTRWLAQPPTRGFQAPLGPRLIGPAPGEGRGGEGRKKGAGATPAGGGEGRGQRRPEGGRGGANSSGRGSR